MQVCPPFWASSTQSMLAVPDAITASGYLFWDGSGSAPNVYTPHITVVVAGGSPPYTYQWLEDAGPSGITINSPTSNISRFYGQSASPSFSMNGVFYCRVTDSLGVVADTTSILVDVERST